MMPAMYSAISGLQAHEQMLNVTANNLANVDTIGYKAERATFASEFSQLLQGSTSPSNTAGGTGGTNAVQIGTGVTTSSVDNEMAEGSLQPTGNTYDVAVNGNGFLVTGSGAYTSSTATPPVSTLTNTNDVSYTRAGNLTTDANGYLCTDTGQYVLGYANAGDSTSTPSQLIQIPSGSTNVAIGENGLVSYTDENSSDSTYGQTVDAGYVALATFPNQAGLERGTDSAWSTTQNSGAATYGTPDTGMNKNTTLLSGELEESNVDMASEFSNMIEAERGYQANTSVMSTVNTMAQTLIQMAQG